MKRIISILMLVILVLPMAAQKVKVDKKKGIIEIDKKVVAKFEETKNENKENVFTFTNLNDNNSLVMVSASLDTKEVSLADIDPALTDAMYFTVGSSFNDKVSEIDYDMIVFSFNDRSIAANLAVKKYGFIDENGLNIDAINKFLDTPILTREQKKEKALVALREKEAARKAILDAYSPTIVSRGVIDYTNKEGVKVGKRDIYEIKNGKTGEKLGVILTNPGLRIPSNSPAIVVYDNDDFGIGGVTGVNQYGTYPMETCARQQFTMTGKDKDALMMNMVETLILNEYFRGGKNSPAVIEANAKEYSSDNKARTNVDGILVLKETGEKVEGKFRVLFRQSEEGRVNKPMGGNIVDLDGGGDGATYFYKDEKGKDKTKIYRGKNIAQFQILKEGKVVESYKAIEYTLTKTYKEEAIISGGALDAGSVGKNLFNKVTKKDSKVYTVKALGMLVAEVGDISIYMNGNDYAAFKKGEEVGVKLDLHQLNKSLVDLNPNCKVVLDKATNNKYENGNISSLKDVINDLHECK